MITEADDDKTEDLVKEITRLHVPRVDAVPNPAHGLDFIILKSAVIDPMAEADRVFKAKYTAAQLRQMAKDGRALRNADGSPSFPIADREDLEAAVHAVGRGGAEHDAIRRFIIRRAKQLGASNLTPDTWASDGSLREGVTKSMDPNEMHAQIEALEDGEPKVDADAAGTGDVTHEGDPDAVLTPAWEAADAATARLATDKLAWLKGLVVKMQEREAAEVAAGEAGDSFAVMSLAEVVQALDFALGVMAKHAVDEQAEAGAMAQEIEERAEELGIVTKAIETGVDRILKAGRVLSAANEADLRDAAAKINTVLARLPEPIKPEAGMSEPVTKAADAADQTTGDEPVIKAEDITPAPQDGEEKVEKAGMSPDELRSLAAKFLKAVPDEKVAAAFQELSKLAAATADDGGETDASTEDAGDPAAPAPEPELDAAPVKDASEPTEAQAPGLGQPPMDAPAPEPEDEPVVKSAAQTVESTQDVTRVIAGELLEQVTKAVAPLLERFGALETRLATVEAQPAPAASGPYLNGAAPAGAAPAAEPMGLEAVRKSLDAIEDPEQRKAAQGAAVHGLLMQALQGKTSL